MALSAILGDISDTEVGFSLVNDVLSTSAIAVKTIVGNHDIYHNRWELYNRLWGSSNYYFVVNSNSGSDLFICLDSASETLGNLQLKWLEDVLISERAKYRYCIMFSHTNTWTDWGQFPSGNMPIDETMVLSNLFAKHKVNYIFSGHAHSVADDYINGVNYITIDSMQDSYKNASYVVVNVDDKISYQYYSVR